MTTAVQPAARDPFPDFAPGDRELIAALAPYTMTSPERLFALVRAVEYVVAAGIAGDLVECGVWRGGSMMAAAATLARLGDAGRDLWLYDTYEGMSAPGAEDVSLHGEVAGAVLAVTPRDERNLYWAYSPLDTVRANLARTGYPGERCRFVKGKVEDTIPAEAPERIAVLRLDTDWYESTRHELEHLYPRLVPGGVLIIDDYGHWRGSRKAVDEYLARLDVPVLLNRIDYTGRIAVKPGPVAPRASRAAAAAAPTPSAPRRLPPGITIVAPTTRG